MRFGVGMGLDIVGFDTSPEARAAALKYGAKQVADSLNEDEKASIASPAANGRELDGAIVCAGVGAAYKDAVKFTGFQG